MTEKNFKLVQWLLYVLMGISAIFTLLFYMSPTNPDLILYWGYSLAILSGVVTLTLAIAHIVKNPKGSVKVLIIIAIMIILGLLSYAMSSNTLTPDQLEKYNITANGVKMVGAGLLMTYFIMIIAIGVFIYTSLMKYIK